MYFPPHKPATHEEAYTLAMAATKVVVKHSPHRLTLPVCMVPFREGGGDAFMQALLLGKKRSLGRRCH